MPPAHKRKFPNLAVLPKPIKFGSRAMDAGTPGLQAEISQSGRAPETDNFPIKSLTKSMDSGAPGLQAEIS